MAAGTNVVQLVVGEAVVVVEVVDLAVEVAVGCTKVRLPQEDRSQFLLFVLVYSRMR